MGQWCNCEEMNVILKAYYCIKKLELCTSDQFSASKSRMLNKVLEMGKEMQMKYMHRTQWAWQMLVWSLPFVSQRHKITPDLIKYSCWPFFCSSKCEQWEGGSKLKSQTNPLSTLLPLWYNDLKRMYLLTSAHLLVQESMNICPGTQAHMKNIKQDVA